MWPWLFFESCLYRKHYKKNIVWFKYRVTSVVKLSEKMHGSARIDRRDTFCSLSGMRYNKFNT